MTSKPAIKVVWHLKGTYDLHFGHVLLPPQVLVVLGTQTSQAVVHVHHEMYEAV